MEPLHYLLMRAHTNVNRWILSEAAGLGLSPGQPKVLEYLMSCEESNQRSIAEHCEIEQATVGSILTRMERSGLIRREQHDGNRRSLYVSLTPQGRQMGERMQQIFREADRRAVANLSDQEQHTLCELLGKVYDAVALNRKEMA